MSSTTLPVCPKTGSTSPSLTVHLCLHTAPGNRECARPTSPLLFWNAVFFPPLTSSFQCHASRLLPYPGSSATCTTAFPRSLPRRSMSICGCFRRRVPGVGVGIRAHLYVFRCFLALAGRSLPWQLRAAYAFPAGGPTLDDCRFGDHVDEPRRPGPRGRHTERSPPVMALRGEYRWGLATGRIRGGIWTVKSAKDSDRYYFAKFRDAPPHNAGVHGGEEAATLFPSVS